MNNEQIAEILKKTDLDARIDTLSEYMSPSDVRRIVAWTDSIGATIHKGRRRVCVSDAINIILSSDFEIVEREKGDSGRGFYFIIVETGPRSNFDKGARFTNLEMRSAIDSNIFANGTKFRYTGNGFTGYWYHGKLWYDGETPKLWFGKKESKCTEQL